LHGIPSGVAVEVALESLRYALGIGKPHDRIARGARDHSLGQRVYLTLARDKRQEEADLRDRLNVMVNGENGKARKLRLKALGRIQDEDLLLVRKIEFFKYFAHGFS